MECLLEKIKSFDSKVAIYHGEFIYTYRELSEEVERIFQECLLDKIETGEVVSILSDYSYYSIAFLLALYKNKNIIVPVTDTLQEEVEDKLNESFSNYVVQIKDGNYQIVKRTQKDKHEIISKLQNSNISGLILFSSGSTGKPKAMVHNFDDLVSHFDGKREKSLNLLIFLMFDHIGGINTLLNILSMGASMVIPDTRNADEICKLIGRHSIRVLPSSPTFLNLILMNKSYEKYNLSSLRMITYGTEVMPESLLNKLKEIFPKTKLLQTFGTSETGIASIKSKSSNSTYMKIDDPNLEYKIVEGELWLKSSTQVIGYLNYSMESFTRDGWFKTGDLIEETDDGYIKIIGRSKEVINVGGEKVLPAEIESVILCIEEVKDVLVYGELNSITGQTVVCDVVLLAPMPIKEIKKIIRKFCNQKLSAYKVPTKVNIVDKTSYGNRFKKNRRK